MCLCIVLPLRVDPHSFLTHSSLIHHSFLTLPSILLTPVSQGLAAEDPNNRVLVVCTELCSLHMQLKDDIDNLVGSILFADGSGAMVVGSQPRAGEKPVFEVHRSTSYIIPDTVEQMTWDMTRTGMQVCRHQRMYALPFDSLARALFSV